MKKIPLILTNYRLVCLLWIAVAAFCWHYKFTPNRYNNYVIFKQVFNHTTTQTNLYGFYPDEYYDANYYGPTFSVFVAPFALLPDVWGFLLWSLVSAVALLWAVHLLPISEKRKMLLLLLCSIEFANTVHNIQFNTIVTAFIIFSFVMVERGKDGWATLFIALGTLIKIYPVAAIVFFIFSKNKKWFIASGLMWLAIFFALPMLISSPQFVIHSYADWLQTLKEKNLSNISLNTTQDISIMGVFRKFLNNPNIATWPFLLFGAGVVGAAALRLKQYKSIVFRMQVLACVLMMVVLFSTGSEHPTYVIAVTGAILWMFLQENPFTQRNILLIVLLLVITGLGPTDAFPKHIRNDIIMNYVMKAWPCLIVWFIMIHELLFKDFIRNASAAHLTNDVFAEAKREQLSNNMVPQ
jgi:hypothetical protein